MALRGAGSLLGSVVLIGALASCGARGEDGTAVAVPQTIALDTSLPDLTTEVAPLAAPPVIAATIAVEALSAEPDGALDIAVPAEAVAQAGRLTEGRRRITIDFTGDTLIHSPLVVRARENAAGLGYDFAPMFDRVAPILRSADLAVCHLESPVAPPGEALSTFPNYGIPAEIAPALADGGYDRCSTASNHVMDRGVGGIDATVSALLEAGLTQHGMARTPDETVASIVEAGGVRVAHLSYTFGTNGLPLPADQPWRSNLIDVPAIVSAATDARARGAEIVVVNLHWGDEGSPVVTRYQRDVAEAITRAGVVDVIVGEHAHVVQPIEQVNGTWVVYGMGNFLSNMPTGSFPPSSQDGVIVSIAFAEQAAGGWAVERPVVIPTWVDRSDGFVIRPIVSDLRDPSVSAATKDAMYASLQRTGSVVGGFVQG